MKLREYQPSDFNLLRRAALQMGVNHALLHRPFVDYYYASNDFGRLFMMLGSDGEVIATIGIDRMRFQYGLQTMEIAFASNFFSLQPGAGGYLYLHWMKMSDGAIVFGGSPDTHNIISKQKNWKYFNGIDVYTLNEGFTIYPEDSGWRALTKKAVNPFVRQPLSKLSMKSAWVDVGVREERSFIASMIPKNSLFSFRFAPTMEYLQWRFSLDRSFARYRIFSILKRAALVGYVVLQEFPDRIVVSHCDGSDPLTLAQGVLKAALQAAANDRRPRSVVLASSHSTMRAVYEQFGFKAARPPRLFALGSLNAPLNIEEDTSGWLVNYEWGDNALRAPFPEWKVEAQTQTRSRSDSESHRF